MFFVVDRSRGRNHERHENNHEKKIVVCAEKKGRGAIAYGRSENYVSFDPRPTYVIFFVRAFGAFRDRYPLQLIGSIDNIIAIVVMGISMHVLAVNRV